MKINEVERAIETMEKNGATFVNKQRWDVRRRRYLGSVGSAVAMVVLMLAMNVFLDAGGGRSDRLRYSGALQMNKDVKNTCFFEYFS